MGSNPASPTITVNVVCGRFVGAYRVEDLIADLEPFATSAGLALDFGDAAAVDFISHNVAPTQVVPVLVLGDDAVNLTMMRWGLVPSWSDDPRIGAKMINARAETITEKPSFKGLVASHRCLVPMSGFYEWNRSDRAAKVPYFFSRSDGRVMLAAGLWTNSPVLGSARTFTMITRESGPDVGPVHHRSPAHFAAESAFDWMTGSAPVGTLVDGSSQPVLSGHRVGTDVNRVANNHPGLIDPVDDIAESEPDQPTLF